MILKYIRPHFPLNQYIGYLTYYSGYMPEHFIERLVPDGTVNIIINLDEIPKYIYDNHTLEKKIRFTRAWVSGMQSNYISISAESGSEMMIIQFLPGGSFPFLKIPVNELQDIVIDAELILGNKFIELRDRINETNEIKRKFDIVEYWFLKKYEEKFEPDDVIKLTIDKIKRNPSVENLQIIRDSTGYSQKQFIHIFKKYVGLTPKLYQRIVRFNHVLTEIKTFNYANWTSLALDCGYYDQAHFIREFREFSGFNPAKYLRDHSEYINYIPIK